MTQRSRVAEDVLRDATALIARRIDPAAILLFGSAAGAGLAPDSDIDFAVLLDVIRPDAFELAALRVDLEARVGREVDVVVLDTASPILAMEILRGHRVLLDRQPDRLQAFVVQTLGAYFDLKRARRPIEEALLSQGGR